MSVHQDIFTADTRRNINWIFWKAGCSLWRVVGLSWTRIQSSANTEPQDILKNSCFWTEGPAHLWYLQCRRTELKTKFSRFSCFFFLDLEEKSRAMSAIEEEKSSIASNLQTNQSIIGEYCQTNQSIIGEYCIQPADQPVNYRRVLRPTCRPTSQL